MSVQEFFNFLDNNSVLDVKLSTLLSLLVIVVVAIIFERIITKRLGRLARRTHLAPNVANSLVLTFRLVILVGALVAIVRAGGLPTEWFVAFSALGGAALGFASTKTIGNFVAGLYLLAAHPFRVGDYVRVGTVEGIVEEMAINYTKILTISNNVVSISNLQIMDRDITNYLHERGDHSNLYCYSFEIGFDHSVPTTRIEQVFDEVFEQQEGKLAQKPNHMLIRSDAFGRVYMVYLYVADPEEIFIMRPRITEEIFKRWDDERKKQKE